MARLGEQLQKLIEPVIRDFIESMEPGVPRVEIESRRKENSCVVLMRFKKSLYEEKLCSRQVSAFQVTTT